MLIIRRKKQAGRLFHDTKQAGRLFYEASR
jgi:hypothetical protein